MKKIVLTGAAGALGHQLRAPLAAMADQLVSTDLADTVEGLAGNETYVKADLGDAAAVMDLLEGAEMVVHFGAIGDEAPFEEILHSNFLGAYNVWNAAQKHGVRRIVYASSIAVFGDPLPAAGVDDRTPLAPRMVYGGHKAMMEIAVAMMHNRGEIEGISVRLPGILARPKGPSGMKSAFMSDLFHALRAGEAFICPVSTGATIWAQSVSRCADNLLHALTMDAARMPATRVVTLPAQRITMGDLAAEIARQCSVSPDLVTYQPNAALEAAFGANPPLATPAADHAGFAHDGDPATLVAQALSVIAAG